MAVKIRLKRMGKIRAPFYRIVVADSRTKRDGRAIEEIGKYHPAQEPSLIEVNSERARYWLGVGAQPTEQVLAILKITGDWQAFKGLPGAEGTLQVAAPKADKRAIFEAVARESMGEPKEAATTPRARKPKPKAEEAAPGSEKAASEKAEPEPPKARQAEPAEPAEPAEQVDQAEAPAAEQAAPPEAGEAPAGEQA